MTVLDAVIAFETVTLDGLVATSYDPLLSRRHIEHYRVLRLKQPGRAWWDDHEVEVVGIEWDAQGMAQRLVLKSGVMLPWGWLRFAQPPEEISNDRP